MGTDKKTTLKEINLTPGPGHYIRVDEQYPRTFHHATKHGTNFLMSPTMSSNFDTFGQLPMATQMTLDSNQKTADDIAEAKRNSIHQQKTQNNFFMAPTGSMDQFYDTMMSSGIS